jgi:regulator of RNase E activity RraA
MTVLLARGTEHGLQGSRKTLADGPSLAGDASTICFHEHIHAGQLFRNLERCENGSAVLVLGEKFIDRAIVDEDVAAAFREPHASHGRFAATSSNVKRLRRFRGLFLLGHDREIPG